MLKRTKKIGIPSVTIASASILMTITTGLLVIFLSSEQQEAVAQQQSNMTTTQSIMPASTNKTFYIFSVEVEGVNETAAGIAGDIYSLPVIEVNRGDSVTVHFYNTEEIEVGETPERHSFTIDAQPYSVDIDTAAGETGNATFTADQEGIFQYHCKYHPETMRGQLAVLPPSSPGGSLPAT